MPAADAPRRVRLWTANLPSPRLVAALALSILAHLVGGSFLDLEPGGFAAPAPLTAELKALPPPPLPQPVAKPPPRPKPKAARTSQNAPSFSPPAPAEAVAQALAPSREPPAPTPEMPDAPPYSDADPVVPVFDKLPPGLMLPPRIDLVYTVLYGAIGLHVGQSSYRFEHRDGRYSIQTVGEAEGLLALLYRGKLRATSQGRITLEGLQPEEVAIERGIPVKREAAVLDWQALRVTFRDGTTETLPPGTLDLLSFFLQFYFVPPAQTLVEMPIVTPRRLARYRFERKGVERVNIEMGDFDAELWSRTAMDNSEAEALVWLAPTIGNVPIKIRVKDPQRGTGELRLAKILAEASTAPP